MIEIKTIYPYVDEKGQSHSGLIKVYAEDEKGIRFKIKNKQTLAVSDDKITFFPFKFTFIPTEEKCEFQPNVKKKQQKKEKEIDVGVFKEKVEIVAKKNEDKVLEVSETEILEDKNNIKEKDENENELY